VDLLILALARQGVNFMHYRSDQAIWRSVHGLPELNQASLGVLTTYSGKPGEEGSDAAWGFPELPEGITPQELMHKISDLLVQFAFKHHEIRPRNCLIIGPELVSLPLLTTFGLKLLEIYNDEAHLAELDITSQLKDENNQDLTDVNRTARFAGFQDRSLGAEILWPELGVKGKVRETFSPDDILSALRDGTEIVHLVTHGVLDHLSPAFSFIVADGHPLFSFDFFDCELTTKLLILNTCSSASGGFYGGSPGASPLRIAVAGGVEIGVGNLFPVETGLATRFGFAFQKAIASGECSASAFTKALFAIKEDKDNVASFALVGRSPESLFSSGWTQRLLHKAQERVTN
jgi:hypothetical protein